MYYAILQSKSFFLFNSMPLLCIVICLLWLGSSYRITAKFCFTQQCLVFSLEAMYSPFKMFIHQYQSWLIPRSFGWQKEENLQASCASCRTNTVIFALAKIPQHQPRSWVWEQGCEFGFRYSCGGHCLIKDWALLLLKSFTANFGRDTVGPHIYTEYVNEGKIDLTHIMLLCKKTKSF